jgi:uncharacterized protein with PIN domain
MPEHLMMDGATPKRITACFRFYEELNDSLPPNQRKVAFMSSFRSGVTVKHAIECLGVPPANVDLVLVNGESVGFDYRLQNEDRVSLYPVFESLDITPLVRLRPRPLRRTRFVADAHLGKLATYLRLLGFDTLYRDDRDDAGLVHVARRDRRILLTRNRRLLIRREVSHGYAVSQTDPRKQVEEVLQRFDLYDAVQPFRRCLRCNGEVEPVTKAQIGKSLPMYATQHYDRIWVCRRCGKAYWRGGQHRRLRHLVEEVLSSRS